VRSAIARFAALWAVVAVIAACPAPGSLAEDRPASAHAAQQTTSEGSAVRHVTRTGVRVVVRPEAGRGLVAVVAAIGTSDADARARPEVKHVVARSLFGSSSNLSAEGMARVIGMSGGSLTIEALPDCIVVRCATTSGAFLDAVYAIGQALKGAQFGADELRRAASALASDVAAEAGSPLSVGAATARARLFGDHPYAAQVAPFSRLAHSQITRYHHAAFTPKNTVIAVVGDIGPDAVVRALENQLVDYDRPQPQARGARATGAASAAPELPPLLGAQSATVRTRSHSGASVVAIRTPGRSDRGAASHAVLAAVVGGGKGSRLFDAIRDARGIGYAVGAEAHLWRDAGMLVAYVEHDARRHELSEAPVSQLVAEVMESVVARPPTESELLRAKRYVLGARRRATERSLDLAQALAETELLEGDWSRLETTWPERIEAVTVADVVRAAQTGLRDRVTVTPRGDG